MSPDPSLQTLFNEALEREDPAERARFLDDACGADAALRERVEKLLSAHREAGGFFSQPSKAPSSAPPSGAVTSPASEKPGDRIGRYRLLQQIGEGGCGLVYMAEQEEPVHRRVALKVIKLGMDTKQVIARFEAERQALALMDHPNIASVFDAGATAAGRPYFVMELVRGVKITEFCDQKRLSTKERLELFIAVCHAVQHAHQKGIIHRDVKPSNILVTTVDGASVPKVIDFGIAKATNNQPLTDRTLFTAFEQFIGTPAYMSPEQAEMSGVDIDTRTDIYSLGVLLYELLTGCTPFEPKELLAAGLDGMRRIIREAEPPRPSNRLSTMAAEALTTTAQHRHTESPKLLHLVRGDLDWVAMKCLEKDRARRYETANALAADLRRHLANEPVVARPPSRWYEFQKIVRRHKFGFVAATAVFLALAIGLGISTWQFVLKSQAYQRAAAAEQEQARQRRIAETREKQSQQVAQFLKDMLEGVGPSVALGRDTALLREILDKTAERVGKDLKNQPEVEAELRSTIGHIYHELGDFEKARQMHDGALHLRKTLFGETNLWVAASLSDVGYALEELARREESETMQRAALTMRRELLGNDHLDVALSLDRLADAQFRQSKLTESEAARREALRIRRKLLGNDSVGVADSLNDLSMLLAISGQLVEAEAVAREALAICRKLPGNEHPSLATSLMRLSWVLDYRGQWNEAEATARQALAMRKKLLGVGHPYTLSAMDRLSIAMQRQGMYSEAIELRREELALRKKTHGEESAETVECLGDLATALKLGGDSIEAEATCQQLIRVQRNTLHGLRRKLPPNDPQLAAALARFARGLLTQQKFAEAEAPARESLAIREKSFPEAWPTFNSRSMLGGSLLGQGRFAEAEPFLLSGYEGMKQNERSTPKIWLKAALERLTQLYEATGQLAKAAEWKLKLAEFNSVQVER